MIITMPDDVEKIIEILEKAGYEAYAVGGCIRDVILGREPDDWDITTSAHPGEVKRLFKRTFDTGIQHGTVTVLMHGVGYEVTTFRIDGVYEDARHPKEVTFTDDLTMDLERRDFTINALAYNHTRGLVDRFGGIEDMRAGIIRCVGDPVERFTEDALRMMRAVRFAAQLGFRIDPDTAEAASKLAPNLSKVSAERIMTELTKLLLSDHPDMLRNCYELGLTAVFLPEFDKCMISPQNNRHHCYNVGEHILHTMSAVRPDRVLRFTMMLHDIAKPMVMTVDEDGSIHNKGHADVGADLSVKILHRLKSDNDLIDRVKVLIRYHDWRFEPTARGVRRVMSRLGSELFPLLLEVQRADIAGQSDYMREEKLRRLDEVEAVAREITEAGEALSIRDLKVNGQDLIACGISPGPQIGTILEAMLEHVLEVPGDNEKDILIGMFVNKPSE
ncbi:MAG: polynucleotide adenylyltransferase [Lachnospiraceae bacterium]|nr:polynucleotide adenylyltransferase [Lachnospiraceae bacterium]MBQ8948151.1 polynucleotide adenylyltransferase [Lachnospiraceae bacterium]